MMVEVIREVTVKIDVTIDTNKNTYHYEFASCEELHEAIRHTDILRDALE